VKHYFCWPLITLLLIAHQPIHSEIDPRLIKEVSNGYAYMVAWSPDGNTIAIYDANTGKVVVTLSSPSALNSVYGRTFATGKLQTTTNRLYNSGEKKPGTLQTGNASLVAISPNKSYLAVGKYAGTIDIWDVVPQKLKFTPAGNTGPPDL
jgi:WD40 repeat protein